MGPPKENVLPDPPTIPSSTGITPFHDLYDPLPLDEDPSDVSSSSEEEDAGDYDIVGILRRSIASLGETEAHFDIAKAEIPLQKVEP